ncbi:hypothetical protein OSTOST_02045, partial [Ostertagia ostertagi]
LRSNNTGIIYVPIEKPVNQSNVDEITHNPNNVADPQNLTTKPDPVRLEKAKDWLVQRLNGTPATTTEAWETTKEKHGTTPAAADRTTESQAETQRTGVRGLPTTAEMPQLEATTTTEAWETTKEKHGTTPTAADRTTKSQAETQRTGVRGLPTTAEMPQLEATTTTEGPNLSVSPVHTPSPPDDSTSATKSIVFLLDASSAALGEAWKSRETTKEKSVVVFSNGQTSTCNIPLTGNKDERSLANELHNNNTGIIYLPIEKPVNRSYLDEITHDPNNVADPQNLTTKQDPARLEKAKDWLVQRLNGTSATTTEAWETTKEKHGTTPTAADRTTESQAETQRTGVRELSTTAEMPQSEATITTEGPNLSVSPVHTASPPDDSTSATKSIVFLLDASSAALGEAWKNVCC